MTEEEKARNRERDPIETFKKRVLERELLSESQIAEIDDQVAAIIEEAVKFAEESAWPDKKELFTDVYVNYP
jgi:pyruvate dehydrogenase E1 component alpha subunit